MKNINLHKGNCLDVLKTFEDNSVDSIVTDPPYGLSFMGKKWDYDVPDVAIWVECLRVLKPGGHLLAFAGTRTQHRMAVRIEDAGFEIRDMIAWIYGGGFPKSLDVSKAIDKAAGAEREIVGREKNWGTSKAVDGKAAFGDYAGGWNITAPATEDARQWQGWGTALKPALEPITVARKPLIGTVAENVLTHGTGALNIDRCRVHADDAIAGRKRHGSGIAENHTSFVLPDSNNESPAGRWPANLIHDGSEEVLEGFPVTGASNSGGKSGTNANPMTWQENNSWRERKGHDDNGGSAARFFYCAKASKADRNAGLDDFEGGKTNDGRKKDADNAYQRGASIRKNTHPTVKPTDLMRYLVKMVTPPGGTTLDPFMGSGSTGRGAMLGGFNFIGIEMIDEYIPIATARIEDAKQEFEKNNNIVYNNLFEEE